MLKKKIKAHLDTTFTKMGIKGNEKSPAYVEAMANAKADYALSIIDILLWVMKVSNSQSL